MLFTSRCKWMLRGFRIIIDSVMLLVLAVCVTSCSSSSPVSSVVSTPVRTSVSTPVSTPSPTTSPALEDIAMQPHPTLVIDHALSLVRVLVNAGDSHVRVIHWVSGTYTRDDASNTVSIDLSQNQDPFGNVTITAPANTDLKIDATAIEVFGIRGQMTLITPSGEITLLQSTLAGQSSITGGKIIFQGALDPQSSTSFSTTGGSIDLTLSKDATFHLDITGILGPVLSTFPAIDTQVKSGSMYELVADVGNASSAKIKMDVNGSVVLIKGE